MKQIISFLGNIAFSDIIDIAIVSFVIYRFLILIQGTRAVQMLVGVGALGSLYWISVNYQLYSLNWILNHFFDYFFVILIILFQDQIRNALVSMGKASFFRGRNSSVDEGQIEEIIEACSALSKERTGAIIVFEKLNGLLNYAETGTQLDSQIHTDIIYSLFQTNSPLHDGAVIISRGKIKAAGCFLPLSKSIEIDRHYGTRHRAALGITEVTDSVVITVSEETGRMTLCVLGKFHVMKNEEDLRRNLKRFLRDSNDIEWVPETT